MNSSLGADLNAALWGDYSTGTTFPTARPLLAHYTSVGNLEKIVNNEELWFSNPLYMNDLEELKFGMNTGAREFRSHAAIIEICGDAAKHAKLIKEFDRLFQDFDSNHAFDTYVACFSEHAPEDDDGRLSMWRGYGSSGSGVAIVFDSAKIRALESSPLIVGKVRYRTQLQGIEWIDEKIVALAEVLKRHVLTDEALLLAAHSWIERLKEFALFTKHTGFDEEQEWRIVYSSERDKSRTFAPMLGYAITTKGVEPKLKVKIGDLPSIVGPQASLNDLVDRIVLGPTISTILAANSVRRMLELSKTPALATRVRESSIPFRP